MPKAYRLQTQGVPPQLEKHQVPVPRSMLACTTLSYINVFGHLLLFFFLIDHFISAVFTVVDPAACLLQSFSARRVGVFSKMAGIQIRDQVDGSSSSWEVCMSKSYCKYVKFSEKINVNSQQETDDACVDGQSLPASPLAACC